MALCLTAGRSKLACGTPISGGIKNIYMVDTGDIASVTVGVGGDVTAITMVALAVFYKFEFANNTAVFTASLTNPDGSTLITQNIAMTWRGRSQADMNALMELANCTCGLTVIHEENNGNMYIWGYEPTEEALLFGSEGSSGTLKSDPNQEVVTIQANATFKERTFTGTVPV